MTLSTGRRNVNFRNRRLCIRRRQNVVTVVTVATDRRTSVAAGHGFSVHALSIGQEGPVTDTASLHHRFVPVTAAARLGEIRAIDCRFRIAGRQDCRQIAILRVAVKTGRAFRSVMNRLRVESAIISRMRLGVEKRTGQIGKRLAGRVATLTLKCRRRCGNVCVRPADGSAGIRPDGSGILITLGRNGFQSARKKGSTKERPGQDETDSKVASHGLDPFSGTGTEKYPRCLYRASGLWTSEVFKSEPQKPRTKLSFAERISRVPDGRKARSVTP